MGSRQPWTWYVAVAIALGLMAGATYMFPVISGAFAIAALVAALGGIVTSTRMRDPYSLESLRRLEEKAELDAIDVPDAGDDSVLCIHCQEPYSARFPTCPRCLRK